MVGAVFVDNLTGGNIHAFVKQLLWGIFHMISTHELTRLGVGPVIVCCIHSLHCLFQSLFSLLDLAVLALFGPFRFFCAACFWREKRKCAISNDPAAQWRGSVLV